MLIKFNLHSICSPLYVKKNGKIFKDLFLLQTFAIVPYKNVIIGCMQFSTISIIDRSKY